MFNIDFDLILFRLKIISTIFSLIFLGLGVYFVIKFQELVGIKVKRMMSVLRSPKPATGGALSSKWDEILRHIDSTSEMEWKFAVIEADKLTDEVLKKGGFKGETMGDRLMSIEKGKLESLEGVWEAHKVRNKLVHDTSYFLRHAEAKRAIQLYSKTLRELNAIS